jgi:hypothetical protein
VISIRDSWVRLRTLTSAEYEELFRTEVAWHAGAGWRFAGRTPSYSEYVASLYADSIATLGVCRLDGSLLGVVIAYEPDHRSGTVWIAVMSTRQAKGSGLVLVGLGHLITELFTNWSFRVVLAESAAPAYEQFRSGMRRSFREQGRLEAHRFSDGAYHDVVYLAIEREAWMAGDGQRYLRRRAEANRAVLPPAGGSAPPARPFTVTVHR